MPAGGWIHPEPCRVLRDPQHSAALDGGRRGLSPGGIPGRNSRRGSAQRGFGAVTAAPPSRRCPAVAGVEKGGGAALRCGLFRAHHAVR